MRRKDKSTGKQKGKGSKAVHSRPYVSSFRKVLLLAGVAAVGTYAGLTSLPQSYRADARILLSDPAVVSSQIAVLQDPAFLGMVASRLDLGSDEGFLDGAVSGLNSVLRLVGLSNTSTAQGAGKLADALADRLDVTRSAGGAGLEISYAGYSPQVAADVANGVMDEYATLVMTSAAREGTAASRQDDTQLLRLRQEVAQARKAADDYRLSIGLPLAADEVLRSQELAQLGMRYSQAQSDQAEAQAKVELMRDLMKTESVFDAASEVLNSPMMRRLQERRAEIQATIAEKSITLLANHPDLKALQSQLSDNRRLISREASRILTGLEAEARLAEEQVDKLKAHLDGLKQDRQRSEAEQQHVAQLEAIAEAKQQQLEKYLTAPQMDAVMSAERLAGVNIESLQRAEVPTHGQKPDALKAATLVGVLTLLLGSLLAFYKMVAKSGRAKTSARSTGKIGKTAAGNKTLQAGPLLQRQEPVMDLEAAAEQDNTGTVAAKDAPQGSAEEFPAIPSQSDVEGFIGKVSVFVTVDDPVLSNQAAFECAGRMATAGSDTLFMEVFPELADQTAAAGFSDLVAGAADFGSAIYQDETSGADIIENGRLTISDEIAEGEPFKRVLSALLDTYDSLAIDLGLFDGTQASEAILKLADHIQLISAEVEVGDELQTAADLLQETSGATVTIVRRLDESKNSLRATA